ncbi:venom serine protease-like [Venturia canescens]|uniref:venom serine protease-like n=1 Tax=Venturia canescens TaxID=32260 RepID=UPI001C9C3060|nr:venom serine protease-like [Venturia canescens]
MYGSLTSLVIFLALFGGNNGDRTCNWETNLEPGKSYPLINTGYPNWYSPGSTCKWVFKSKWDQLVNIQCRDVAMSSDQWCQGDRLEIQDGVGTVYSYCSLQQFPYTSQYSRVTVNLRTFTNRGGGRFSCTVQAVQPRGCDCGRRNAGKIYGGTETGVNEYPFMAALVDAQTYEIFCGGTIINPRQVLTAAHCVKNKRAKTYGVLVGAHNLKRVQDTPNAKFFLAEDSRVHWSYEGPTSGLDIAIVTIDGQFTFNQVIGPVCLPFQYLEESFSNKKTDILGWGADSSVNGPLNVLMKAMVTITTQATCRAQYPGTSDRHICTQDQHRDSCQFDSGGPLTIQFPTSGRVVQIGIMNRGPGCGQGEAALNLRVGPLVEWIIANTPTDFRNYCRAG